MYKERREHLKDTLSTGADFVPVIGDIKSYAEAESALDYLAATIGVVPGVGDASGKAIKAVETALKKGNLAEASRLINETSQYVASGAKATEPLKALPEPRQIDASWSSNTYKHGGLMTGIEHVFYRHGLVPDSPIQVSLLLVHP